ncbi:MAG: hypothetical protein HYX73_04675 [Acidobacteria bacterium]|nr:hypothetical protein [Acidobacteriota bacterium]
MAFRVRQHAAVVTLAMLAVLASGCAKRVKFRPSPLAGKGTATAKVELTYDRNNTLEVKLSGVPDPAVLKPGYSRYVLWAATPDRQHIVNIGQLRVDEKMNAEINTLTPLRSFLLFITVESSGDVMTPGPDVIFEAPQTDW